MIEIQGEKYSFKFDRITDCPLDFYQHLFNLVETHEENYFDLLGDAVALLTDIPKDIIDVIPIKELKRLFDGGTDLSFDRDEASIVTSFNNLKAVGEPEKYQDIEFNRLQYRILKETPSNQIVSTIAAVVFVKELSDLKNPPLLKQRKRDFSTKMTLGMLLPYLVRYIETTMDITEENIDVFKGLRK